MHEHFSVSRRRQGTFFRQWRKREAKGKVIVVRYADDIVAGFDLESDARRFWVSLPRLTSKLARVCPTSRAAQCEPIAAFKA